MKVRYCAAAPTEKKKIENTLKSKVMLKDFIYLFGVLHHFQHRTGHIMMGSWKGRGNQYIQLVSGFCTVNCRPTTTTTSFPT